MQRRNASSDQSEESIPFVGGVRRPVSEPRNTLALEFSLRAHANKLLEDISFGTCSHHIIRCAGTGEITKGPSWKEGCGLPEAGACVCRGGGGGPPEPPAHQSRPAGSSPSSMLGTVQPTLTPTAPGCQEPRRCGSLSWGCSPPPRHPLGCPLTCHGFVTMHHGTS